MEQNYSGLPRAGLETSGVTRGALARFYGELEGKGVKIDSFLLLSGGRVVEERYWPPAGAEEPHPMYSVSKSVTATAIGLLEAEGKLSVEDALLDFFPEYRGKASAHAARVKLRHLLTMTCGQESEPPRGGVEDWVGSFFSHPFPHEPGAYFFYNALSSYLLTALIRRVTGENLTEYLKPRVLDPLGIEGIWCEKCPLGTESGAGGLHMRTMDLAKLALLYLQDGVWQGRRLLPTGWVERASSIQFRDRPDDTAFQGAYCASGYGYQMWRCAYRDAYRFDGALGQYAFLVPSLGRILVTTASDEQPRRILEAFTRHLLPHDEG